MLEHATLESMLTPTTKKWLGCHIAAHSACDFLPTESPYALHLKSIRDWIACMERLIPDEVMRHANLGAMGAYCLFGFYFTADAAAILKKVGGVVRHLMQAFRLL